MNNIAGLTVNMEPAPQRDTSNCTELSAITFDQGQELRRTDTSVYTDIYIAPNGTARSAQTLLESSDSITALVNIKNTNLCR